MDVVEMMSKNLSFEIDMEVLRRLLEIAGVPEKEIEKKMEYEYEKQSNIDYREMNKITNRHVHKF